MSKPIETLHITLSKKFDFIKRAINCVGNKKLLEDFDIHYRKWRKESLIFLSDHVRAVSDDAKSVACRLYTTWVQAENIIGKLDGLHMCLAREESKDPALADNLSLYVQTPLTNKIQKIDYKLCKCGERMTVYDHTSEMRCTSVKCGINVKLDGTLFEDSSCYSGEPHTSAPKRGRHETSRHCKLNLDRILALKPCALTAEQSGKMDKWIATNVLHKAGMSCSTFRRCFKDIKESRLNDHIPYIRQQVISVSPEALTSSETRMVYIYFDKTVAAINEINQGDAGNMKYYPFFIFKILELILNKSSDKFRLQSIIDCIHFQRDDTIVQNDLIWFDVCNHVEAFSGQFKKTDRNLLQGGAS